MLAPTRDLVAELNRRARNHRLNGDVPNAVVRLADGNQASAGDVIITRRNDRRLRLTATDWVKNGDRWTITESAENGDLTVRHNRSRLTVRLPADYVRDSTGLGYASTIHAAQGVSADTMHGLAHRAGVTPAAVHHAHPRPGRQPPLPASRRRRRPAHRHSTRHRRTPHPDRDPAPDPRPRRRAPPRPPPCCENSATRLPGCLTPFGATPTGSMWRPSSSLDPRSFRCSTAEPTRSSPNSPASRPGRR